MAPKRQALPCHCLPYRLQLQPRLGPGPLRTRSRIQTLLSPQLLLPPQMAGFLQLLPSPSPQKGKKPPCLHLGAWAPPLCASGFPAPGEGLWPRLDPRLTPCSILAAHSWAGTGKSIPYKQPPSMTPIWDQTWSSSSSVPQCRRVSPLEVPRAPS